MNMWFVITYHFRTITVTRFGDTSPLVWRESIQGSQQTHSIIGFWMNDYMWITGPWVVHGTIQRKGCNYELLMLLQKSLLPIMSYLTLFWNNRKAVAQAVVSHEFHSWVLTHLPTELYPAPTFRPKILFYFAIQLNPSFTHSRYSHP